jgi:hypothetical protein
MSEIHAPEAGVQQAGVASESTGDSKSAAPRNDTAGTTDTVARDLPWIFQTS